jgi:hypothetical protein
MFGTFHFWWFYMAVVMSWLHTQISTQSSEEIIDKLFIFTPDEFTLWGPISVVLMIVVVLCSLYKSGRCAMLGHDEKLCIFLDIVKILHLEV